MRFVGRVALVTGASSGIGSAIAAELGRAGARVVMTGRRQAPSDLPAGRYVAGDLLDEAFVARLVASIGHVEGSLDILVNSVGLQWESELDTVDLAVARTVLEANVLAPLVAIKHAVPLLERSGHGAIVNVASRLGLVAIKGQAVYSAAKGGLIMLTKGAAIDLAGRGIRVNAVAPGLTATDAILEAWSHRPDPDGHRRLREGSIPMNRLATPDEVARAVAFLASDEASYVTGTVLLVDGGYVAA